jgi:protein-S-isoprenylcysteine O-methyltransferase Ste14
MKRYLIFLYALVGYILSMITLSFLILWVYPWDFMPFYIDTPVIALDINPVLIDTGLLLFFGVQHSVMARSFFKDGWLSNIPEAVKSATFAIASSICLVLIYSFWQPIDGYLWDFQNNTAPWYLMTDIYIIGWLMAFISTFMIDHFELFGLHQGYRVLKNTPAPKQEFQIRFFYKYIRHPIQATTIIGLWATPLMSYGHLLFGIGMTIYVLIGLRFEEKDLIRTFGETYKEYMEKTPFLIPFTKSR